MLNLFKKKSDKTPADARIESAKSLVEKTKYVFSILSMIFEMADEELTETIVNCDANIAKYKKLIAEAETTKMRAMSAIAQNKDALVKLKEFMPIKED